MTDTPSVVLFVQDELSARDQEIASLTAQVSDLQGQVSSLQADLISATTVNDSLRAQLAASQAQVADLQKQLDALQPKPTVKFLVGSALGGNADPSTSFEPTLGYRLMSHRTYFGYHREKDGSMAAQAAKDFAAGREPHISVKPPFIDASHPDWAGVASGKYDAWFKQEFASMQAAATKAGQGKVILFGCHHEPDDEILNGQGRQADYVAMTDHLADLAVAYPAVLMGACLMNYHVFTKGDLKMEEMCPPALAKKLKWYAWDMYQHFGNLSSPTDTTPNPNWNDFDKEFAKMQAWVQANNPKLRWGLAEYGYWNAAAAADPGWIQRVNDQAKARGASFMDYFNSGSGQIGNWQLDGIQIDQFRDVLKNAGAVHL